MGFSRHINSCHTAMGNCKNITGHDIVLPSAKYQESLFLNISLGIVGSRMIQTASNAQGVFIHGKITWHIFINRRNAHCFPRQTVIIFFPNRTVKGKLIAIKKCADCGISNSSSKKVPFSFCQGGNGNFSANAPAVIVLFSPFLKV